MTDLPDGTRPLQAWMAVWTVLSRLLLRPPTRDDLVALRDPGLLAVWPLGRPGFADGLDLLARSSAAGEDAEAVRADHNRLFVGPGHLRAAPYESVHRSEEGLLFDRETHQVRAWYARYGLQAPLLNREPDDHVGLELEFLSHLAGLALAEPERAETILADLGRFVSEHPATWVPGLARLITDGAGTHFYRGVGLLLGATMERTGTAFPGP